MQRKPRKDLKDQKFGSLSVIEYAGNGKWKCQCECGNICEKYTTHLVDGYAKSCGKCNNRKNALKDLKDQTFGNLYVEEYAGNSRWKCKCSCGNETIVRGYELRKGIITRCKQCASNARLDDLTGKIFGSWEVLSYEGHKKWKCKCLDCGNIYSVFTNNLKSGTSNKCENCANKDKRNDLTGKIFGSWKVKKYIGNQTYECECLKCGNTYNVSSANLTSHDSTQCRVCANLEDLKDKQFGEWTVLEYAGDLRWKCRCSCGKEFNVLGYNLRSGHTKSCGHDLMIDLKGQHFGEWEVLEYAGDGYWTCKCSCGTIKNVHSYSLRSGESESCGCHKWSKARKTLLERYNEIGWMKFNDKRSEKELDAIASKENLQNFIKNEFNSKPNTYQLMQKLNLGASRTLKIVHKYELDDDIKMRTFSHYEEEIVDWLKTITDSQIITSDRKVLKGKELDIYIPEKRIAIEFNGNFWHSAIYKDKYYHQQKTFECAKQGIRLIHIFEYEWLDDDKKEKIKNIIASKISDNAVEIDANDTEIKIVAEEEAESFLNKYHLNGYCNFDIGLGLYYKDKLTMIMTFGLLDDKYEILRECAKDNIKVICGTQELVSYFIEKYRPANIIKYIGIDKFTGNNYLKIGFKNNEIIEPEDIWISTSNNTDDDENWILLHDCGKIKLEYREDKTC